MATNNELKKENKELKAQLEALATGKKVIDVVYPHCAKFAQWQELKYSIRSVEKNLVDVEFRLWIVGDRPEWLSDEAHFIEVPCSGKTARLDVAMKRMAVDNHPDITESYIWMNDDIYMINPVTLADVSIPKVLHDLSATINRYDRQTTWGNDIHETYKRLKSENLPTLHYAVHTPYLLEKSKSKELFRVFDLENKPFVFENLYYNFFFAYLIPYWLSLEETNNLLFCVNRQNPDWNKIAIQLKTKKFMNNSEGGMTERLKTLIQSLFPEKSTFEI